MDRKTLQQTLEKTQQARKLEKENQIKSENTPVHIHSNLNHSPSIKTNNILSSSIILPPIISRKSLCIDVLSEGFVSSFIEFFYLSHRYSDINHQTNDNKNIDNNTNDNSNSINHELLTDSNLSEDELIFLKENLVMSEIAKRKCDWSKMHIAYKNMGDFFKNRKEYQTAVYFYDKCISQCLDLYANTDDKHLLLLSTETEAEKETESAESEIKTEEKQMLEERKNIQKDIQSLYLISYLDLGLTYEALNNIQFAIECHEKHLYIATHYLHSQTDARVANRNLIRTFKLKADELQSNGNYVESMAVLEKCIISAHAAHDLMGESIAHKTLGNIMYVLKQYRECIAHYKKYLKISLEIDDAIGEGNANFQLGKAYQCIGDELLAMRYFEEYMKISCKDKQMKSESEACLALADIYLYSTKDFTKAVEYYAMNFEINKKIDNQEMTNNARMKLGIAKANEQMNAFFKCIVDNDIAALLEWKSTRKMRPNL